MSNVAQTSIENYYSMDNRALRETLLGKVALEIRRINDTLGPAYISQVAHNLNLQKSDASARMNELRFGPNAKKLNPDMVIKPFQVQGRWYKMKHAGKLRMPDPKNPHIRRRVDTWAIVECEQPAQQGKLF